MDEHCSALLVKDDRVISFVEEEDDIPPSFPAADNTTQDSQAMDRCHRIGQNRPVAVYRLLTFNSVDIDMMEKQISKKKLERMAVVEGDFRKAGSRSNGEFRTEALNKCWNLR